MKKIKLTYYILLLILPILLVGSLKWISQDKIRIDSSNLEVLLAQKAPLEKTILVEIYGEGFLEGDTVYIEGQKIKTEVQYNKQLRCEFPTKELTKSKVVVKVQRQNDIGKIIRSSNAYTIHLNK